MREDMLRIGRAEFAELVDQALEELPAEFLERLENVEVHVEDLPDRELLQSLGLLGRGTLFGLYQGVPRPQRSSFSLMTLPDRIVIYRRPILQACRNRREVVEQVRKTVVHEIAHHFGFSEERLRELGY